MLYFLNDTLHFLFKVLRAENLCVFDYKIRIHNDLDADALILLVLNINVTLDIIIGQKHSLLEAHL